MASIGALDLMILIGVAGTIGARMLRVSRQPSAATPAAAVIYAAPRRSTQLSLSRWTALSPRYHRRRHTLRQPRPSASRFAGAARGEDNEHNESGGDTTEDGGRNKVRGGEARRDRSAWKRETFTRARVIKRKGERKKRRIDLRHTTRERRDEREKERVRHLRLPAVERG